MAKLLRLPRSKVRLGTQLPWNVRDESGMLLLSKGHIILDEHMLDGLLERGAFVDAEDVRRAMAEAEASKLIIGGGVPAKSVAKQESLFELWDQTTQDLRTLLTEPGSAPDFPDRVHTFAQHLVELFDVQPDIAIYRAVRQDNAHPFYYGYSHSVLTAMLCILISRHMGWTDSTTMSLVKAALTMNMTVAELQGQMAAQDHGLRDKQRAVIEIHPTQARMLLEKYGVTDTDWLDAVEQHHERADGSGYPAHRTDISPLASALRAADVYIAKITPRTIHSTLAPKDAITQLYREEKGGPLATALIKELGLYPPGEFVKLATGELGVVVQRTANPKAPVVATITDKTGKACAKTTRQDTGKPEFAIVERVADKSMLKRLAPERLYGFATAPTHH